MKTIKKITAILLIVATLAAMLILSAAAADGTDVPAAEPVFVMDGDRLCSIDFSAVIREDTTIYKGDLVLLGENGEIRRHARFDEEQNGVAVFGIAYDDGSFTVRPLYATAIDNTFCLRPKAEAEMLYDDVGSFMFAMHDLFADVPEAEIEMGYPAITVTRADGEQIREMTLDFSAKAYDDTPMYLDCADLSKTLTFSASCAGLFKVAECTLQPTAYDAETGVLTVSVRNAAGQEGCTLFDCGMTIDGYAMTVYIYNLRVPEGLFFSSRNDKICSAGISRSDYLGSIEGMPVRIAAGVRIPSWILTLGDKSVEKFRSVKAVIPVVILFVIPVFLFQAPALLRADLALFKSLRDYGVKLSSIDWLKIFRR